MVGVGVWNGLSVCLRYSAGDGSSLVAQQHVPVRLVTNPVSSYTSDWIFCTEIKTVVMQVQCPQLTLGSMAS